MWWTNPVEDLVLDIVVQPQQNHNNICVVHGSSTIKNIDVEVSNGGGGLLMDYDSLANMPSLEDVTPTIDSLQGLQHLIHLIIILRQFQIL